MWLKREALRRPPVAKREHAHGSDVENALFAEPFWSVPRTNTLPPAEIEDSIGPRLPKQNAAVRGRFDYPLIDCGQKPARNFRRRECPLILRDELHRIE